MNIFLLIFLGKKKKSFYYKTNKYKQKKRYIYYIWFIFIFNNLIGSFQKLLPN